MISYIYKARDKNGKLFSGHLEAEDVAEARAKLRQAGYYPISIIPEHRSWLKNILQMLNPVGLDDLVIFCQQFSSMIHSGLPILHSLDIIWKQIENERLQLIVCKIKNDLSQGLSLFEAVGKYPNVFPPLFINLIRVGEASGTLDEILQKLVAYFCKEYEVRQKVKSAFVYPVIVITVAIAVVTFMVTVVVPVFSRIFARLAATSAMPLPTVILLAISALVRRLWWTFPLILTAAIVIYSRVRKTKHGKYLIDHIKLELPLFGKIIHKVAISRFARSLGIVIGAGVPMNKALTVTRDISGNQLVKEAILDAEKSIVASGSNLHLSLSRSGLFPDIVIQMIATGEEAGNLEAMLITVSDQIDQEIDYRVKKLTVLLEPALTIILGVVVAFIAVSLYLPIFDMVRLMRR